MNKVDVLIEGYATPKENGYVASSSSCLITTDSGIKIITDPGTNRDALLAQLTERNQSVDDIDFVFLTHHHLDHALLAGIFPNARVADCYVMYTKDTEIDEPQGIPDTNITIVSTPGHELAHGVLVVPDTENGTVVIAGDNFWWSSEEEQVVDVNKSDDFAENMEALIGSRKKVLELADWVVPGHGKMFEVSK